MGVEVGVWSAVPAPGLDTLCADERARVARLHRPEDRALVATAWRLARSVLGEVTGADPSDLAFARTCSVCGHPDHGKPRLVGDGPSFNLSHAPGLVLLAVYDDAEVGVDLEPVPADLRDVAADVLTPSEAAVGLDPLTAWVRKEAVLKADGRGLAVAMTSLDLTAPLAGHVVVDVPLDGYVAALAVAGGEPPDVRLKERWCR